MFVIEAMSRTPVYEQIVQQTEELLLAGALHSGDAMPSVRSLSVELGVNPNTIQKAYSELERRGITFSVPGKGSFLREDAKEALLERALATKVPQFQALATELAKAGVSEETLAEVVHQAFKNWKEGTL